MCGYQLKRTVARLTRRRVSDSFTTTKRHHILSSLILILTISLDDSLLEKIAPLPKISSFTTEDDLNACYSFIPRDMDKEKFFSEYFDAAELLKDFECDTGRESLRKLTPDRLQTTKLALARVVAAKPTSADVERLMVKSKIKSIQ